MGTLASLFKTHLNAKRNDHVIESITNPMIPWPWPRWPTPWHIRHLRRIPSALTPNREHSLKGLLVCLFLCDALIQLSVTVGPSLWSCVHVPVQTIVHPLCFSSVALPIQVCLEIDRPLPVLVMKEISASWSSSST